MVLCLKPSLLIVLAIYPAFFFCTLTDCMVPGESLSSVTDARLALYPNTRPPSELVYFWFPEEPPWVWASSVPISTGDPIFLCVTSAGIFCPSYVFNEVRVDRYFCANVSATEKFDAIYNYLSNLEGIALQLTTGDNPLKNRVLVARPLQYPDAWAFAFVCLSALGVPFFCGVCAFLLSQQHARLPLEKLQFPHIKDTAHLFTVLLVSLGTPGIVLMCLQLTLSGRGYSRLILGFLGYVCLGSIGVLSLYRFVVWWALWIAAVLVACFLWFCGRICKVDLAFPSLICSVACACAYVLSSAVLVPLELWSYSYTMVAIWAVFCVFIVVLLSTTTRKLYRATAVLLYLAYAALTSFFLGRDLRVALCTTALGVVPALSFLLFNLYRPSGHSTQPCVVVVGGCQPGSLAPTLLRSKTSFSQSQSNGSDFECISLAGFIPRDRAGVTVFQNRIYVAGGLDIRSNPLRSVQAIVHSAVVERPDLPCPVYGGALFAVCGDLRYIGGYRGRQTLQAEDWIMREDCWFETPGMLSPRALFGSTVIGSSLFVAGGENHEAYLKSFEMRDYRNSVWISLPPLPQSRTRLAMESVNGDIIVVGGTGLKPVNEVLKFDLRINRWEALNRFPATVCDLALLNSDFGLLAAGGDIGKEHGDRRVWRYGPGDSWKLLSSIEPARQKFGLVSIDRNFFL